MERESLLAGEKEPRASAESLSPSSSHLEQDPIFPQPDPLTSSHFTRMRPAFTALTPAALLGAAIVLLKQSALLLVPSFLQHRFHPAAPQAPPKLHPTAYLDGIRGIASLFVFFFHLTNSIHDNGVGFGVKDHWSPLRLPIIRIFWCGGHAMVAIFFVVSGYSLSIKPVKTMRRHEWVEFRRSLASSVFRRVLRLYLPVCAVGLLIALLLQLGVYDRTRALANDPKYLINVRERHNEPQANLWQELVVWAGNMVDFINVWGTKEGASGRPPYDGHLWSIAAEFRISLHLFLVQLGLSGVRPAIRMILLCVLIFWSMTSYFFGPVLFYSGFLLAELNHYQDRSLSAFSTVLPTMLRNRVPPVLLDNQEPTRRRRALWELFYLCNFVCSLYLISCPISDIIITPGWGILGRLIPSWYNAGRVRWWISFGAVQLVWSTTKSKRLQRIFDNPFSQYMGHISFMMYILHGTVIHTVGYAAMGFFWSITGVANAFTRELGYLMACAVIIPTLIWASDAFWRLVDAPSVVFAKWLEDKVTGKEPADF